MVENIKSMISVGEGWREGRATLAVGEGCREERGTLETDRSAISLVSIGRRRNISPEEDCGSSSAVKRVIGDN